MGLTRGPVRGRNVTTLVLALRLRDRQGMRHHGRLLD